MQVEPTHVVAQIHGMAEGRALVEPYENAPASLEQGLNEAPHLGGTHEHVGVDASALTTYQPGVESGPLDMQDVYADLIGNELDIAVNESDTNRQRNLLSLFPH